MSAGEEGGKIVVALLTLGGIFMARGWKRYWQRRKIQDTPRSEIRSASQGLAEFEGFALPSYGEGFLCFQDRACVFRRIRIEELVSQGKSSSWKKVAEENQGEEFILSDGTGIARVLVHRADLLIEEVTYPWNQLTQEQKLKTIQHFGSKAKELDSAKTTGFLSSFRQQKFRVKEWVIRVGSPVYVRGHFESIQNQKPYLIAPRFLAFLAKIAELRENPTQRMKAFDLDRDGKISEFELMKGADRLFYLSKDDVREDDRLEEVATEGLIRYTPLHGMLIGDSHQETLLNRFGARATLEILGGAALIAAAFGLVAFWISPP